MLQRERCISFKSELCQSPLSQRRPMWIWFTHVCAEHLLDEAELNVPSSLVIKTTYCSLGRKGHLDLKSGHQVMLRLFLKFRMVTVLTTSKVSNCWCQTHWDNSDLLCVFPLGNITQLQTYSTNTWKQTYFSPTLTLHLVRDTRWFFSCLLQLSLYWTVSYWRLADQFGSSDFLCLHTKTTWIT